MQLGSYLLSEISPFRFAPVEMTGALFIIVLIHCQIWAYCDEALDEFYGDIQSGLNLINFLLFPLPDDEVDLMSFAEIVADAEAQAAEIAAAE